VRQCRTEVREALTAARGSAEGRVLAELAAAGIRGSAVAVKIEGDQPWIAMKQKLMKPVKSGSIGSAEPSPPDLHPRPSFVGREERAARPAQPEDLGQSGAR